MYLSAYIQKLADILLAQGKEATSRLYQSLGNSFLSFFGKNIRIDEINEKLIRLYEEYLMAKKLMDNTISFYMRNFRAIMNKAAAS